MLNVNLFTWKLTKLYNSVTCELRFCCRISLAEAHCKLSLRTRVLEEDAVIAVLLCENSVTLKHGSFNGLIF